MSQKPDAPAYQPPALLWEEPFVETVLAVSCAHFPGQSASCDANPCGGAFAPPGAPPGYSPPGGPPRR